MADLTPKQHRVGLSFADLLAELAARAPDSNTKKEVYSLVNSIRKRYGWKREQKRREILRVISLGAATIADIRRETDFTWQDIRDIRSDLVTEGLLRCEWINNGAGRPAEICFLAQED